MTIERTGPPGDTDSAWTPEPALTALRAVADEVERLASTLTDLAPRPVPQAEHRHGQDRLVWTVADHTPKEPWQVVVFPGAHPGCHVITPWEHWSGDMLALSPSGARALALALLAAVEASDDDVRRAREHREARRPAVRPRGRSA